ncbi:hypothetical protein DWU95_29115 [Burkholderia contaminans]|nr:hypothetical protein DWU95_29115 [Burkholderia contaminans]
MRDVGGGASDGGRGRVVCGGGVGWGAGVEGGGLGDARGERGGLGTAAIGSRTVDAIRKEIAGR